jgi:hypothetical protein
MSHGIDRSTEVASSLRYFGLARRLGGAGDVGDGLLKTEDRFDPVRAGYPQKMTNQIKNARDALHHSIEMVPDGHFDEDETDRRRGLWQLWVMLPDGFRTVYPAVLAKTFGQPLEWVHEVLNLDDGGVPA